MTSLSKPIRVLIADDHGLIQEGLKWGLEATGAFAVETVAEFGVALRRVSSEYFDIVLLDLAMPGMDGLTTIEQMLNSGESHRVVLFSGAIPHGLLLRATDAGARGFISKTMGLKSIAAALRLVHDGEVFIPLSHLHDKPMFASPTPKPEDRYSVTPFETLLIERVAAGKTNKEIAWETQISDVAIKNHMRTIYKKLDVKNRAHAATRAREMGLLKRA